jgi:hypothetical protein
VLFDIVRQDYSERFGDEPQFGMRSSVLVPRSARAVAVPQNRTSVCASRRMRTAHASRRNRWVSRRTNLRLWEMITGSAAIVSDCSLQ